MFVGGDEIEDVVGARVLALMGLFGTSVGSYAGGALCDRAGRRDLRWYLWLPAFCTAISVPCSAATVAGCERFDCVSTLLMQPKSSATMAICVGTCGRT